MITQDQGFGLTKYIVWVSAQTSGKSDLVFTLEDTFMQYIGNNVDHDSCTLDGKDTFHGMEMLAGITPATGNFGRIPRRNVCNEEISQAGQVSIKQFFSKHNGIQNLKYGELKDLTSTKDPTSEVELLYKISRNLRNPTPLWSGFM